MGRGQRGLSSKSVRALLYTEEHTFGVGEQTPIYIVVKIKFQNESEVASARIIVQPLVGGSF